MNSQPDSPNDSLHEPHGVPQIDATCEYLTPGITEDLVRVLDEYLDALKHGLQPSREALLAQHPVIAVQLEACLAGLDFIHKVDGCSTGELPQLGDYRIIREVGRGGMGAVFEAEQLSLGRRVALKVLRFGGVSDREAVERFQREAETVAKLHHTNIVPIFAVGSENGINYYSMQFIEGKSLAEVLAERGSGLPAIQAAEIGLQSAEALAHAHQRGVIHRDVKPSNLLLDSENRVWLTDFGLARRLDDVTLSMTGALLGTPRYMSPEQANTSTKRVDFRSDLFSFGATLYELLSGKPAFSGDSPHDVIQHILRDEPARLRSLDTTIPRDLETIVLKCLIKEPQHRYSAARDLADDLRAFLDGRPIRARRANVLEQASRWAKQNRRSVQLSTSVAVLTILAILLGSLGLSQYHNWLQATFQFSAVRPPIVAEVFNREGSLIRTDTLPMQKPTAVPADEYMVRLSSEGKLSQTYTMELDRGQNFLAMTNLDSNDLFPPQSIQRSFDLVNLGSETGVLLWNEDGVSLRRPKSPDLEWKRELNHEQDFCKESPGFEWPWSSPLIEYSGYGSFRYQPWILQTFIDINEDGIGDIIAAARHQAWVMALSGADGEILWFAPRSSHLAVETPGVSARSIQSNRMAQSNRSSIINEPLFINDLDADGINDIIVTVIDIPNSTKNQGLAVTGSRWVEAISTGTGQTIWRHELSNKLFDLPPGGEVPNDLRWYVGAGGMSSGGRSSSMTGKHLSRSRGHLERTGMHLYAPTPVEVVKLATQDRLACIAGTHLVLLDPLSGKESESLIDLGIRPGSAPQWADVDGDSFSDLVFLEAIASSNSYPKTPTARMHVWSLIKRQELWKQALDADWPVQPNWTVESPNWPLVMDLDTDGACEILVPHRRSTSFSPSMTTSTQSTPWGEIVAFHGSTGREIWRKQLVSIDSQVDYFVAGPDINRDGIKDIFAANLGGNNFTIYVDALSGANGQTLWMESFEPRRFGNSNFDFVLSPMTWWETGPDGWPQLLVRASALQGPNPESLLCSFSAGTGQVNHFGYGLTTARPHDLDGDGLQELLMLRSRSATRCDFGGELTCMRGSGKQAWKRLGDLGEPVSDIDNDGVLDFIRSWGDGTLLAHSGATGSLLWRNRPIPAVNSLKILAMTDVNANEKNRSRPNDSFDLDDDGVVDLMAFDHVSGFSRLVSPLHAISGRTGQLLWSMSEVSATRSHHIALACEDLNGDGRVEIVWLAALDHLYPQRFSFSSNDGQLWLFAAESKTGRLLWSQPLSPAYGHSLGKDSPFQFQHVDLELSIGDLNNDGHLDVLAPGISDSGLLELLALNGRDGQKLWKRTRHPDGLSQESLRNWTAPTLCDLNNDESLEVVCIEPSPMFQVNGVNQQHIQLATLHGADGQEHWVSDTKSLFTHFHSYGEKLRQRLRPTCLNMGDGKRHVGVLLPSGDPKFVVWDYDGLVSEMKFEHRLREFEVGVRSGPNEGSDIVVILDESGLSAVPADQLDHPLWHRPLSTAGSMKILELTPGTISNSPEIAVAMPTTDNSVIGIDAVSGKTLWSCPGPIIRDADDGVFVTLKRIDLLGNRKGIAKLVSYSSAHAVECRQATQNMSVEKDSNEANQILLESERSWARSSLTTVDDRWQRALPWAEAFRDVQQQALPFIGWGMFFSLTLVILPLAYTTTMVSKRQFGLKTILGLPILAGVILFSFMITVSADVDFRNPWNRFWMGLAFAPPLLGASKLLKLGIEGKRLSLTFWICVVVTVSCLWGIIQLKGMLAQAPLLPQESLDWSGWYQILVLGFYLTSWLMSLFYFAVWLSSRLTRLWAHTRFAQSS